MTRWPMPTAMRNGLLAAGAVLVVYVVLSVVFAARGEDFSMLSIALQTLIQMAGYFCAVAVVTWVISKLRAS